MYFFKEYLDWRCDVFTDISNLMYIIHKYLCMCERGFFRPGKMFFCDQYARIPNILKSICNGLNGYRNCSNFVVIRSDHVHPNSCNMVVSDQSGCETCTYVYKTDGMQNRGVCVLSRILTRVLVSTYFFVCFTCFQVVESKNKNNGT